MKQDTNLWKFISVLIKLKTKYCIYQWSAEDLLIKKKEVYIFDLSGLLNTVKPKDHCLHGTVPSNQMV